MNTNTRYIAVNTQGLINYTDTHKTIEDLNSQIEANIHEDIHEDLITIDEDLIYGFREYTLEIYLVNSNTDIDTQVVENDPIETRQYTASIDQFTTEIRYSIMIPA